MTLDDKELKKQQKISSAIFGVVFYGLMLIQSFLIYLKTSYMYLKIKR